MAALSRTANCVKPALFPLIAANGVTVSTLYWAQSVVARAVVEFGPSPAISLMPGATLAGYAVGVALLAAWSRDLTSPRGLGLHAVFLSVGLCIAAAAPKPVFATMACVVIGLGCSLTQRLVACATSAVPSEYRPRTIGWIIAAGLCGIVLARAFVPIASAWLGWRVMFWTVALLTGLCGSAATVACRRNQRHYAPASSAPLPTAVSLWRGEAVLRRAALQQAIVFAAFNLGWAIYPRLLGATSAAPTLSMAIVASLGAGAAVLSGRVCGLRDPAAVATTGFGAVALASVTFLVAGNAAGAYSVEMGLLDVGTQVALVANQARAQSLAFSHAMRGRLGAIVTTIGFAGGAIGAAIGNFIP